MVVGINLRDQLAKEIGGRGTIYHAYSEVAGKGKWIVVLNRAWPPSDGLVLYAFMTTKVDRFRRAGIPPSAYLELAVGAYDFCKEPTILDLTSIQLRPLAELLSASMFKYCGSMSQADVQMVDEVIAKSTFISQRHKKQILPI
jgi:hypothetical protein